MDQRTKDLFTNLEKKLIALEQELGDLPTERLSQKPNPNAWSVLEIMHHLKIAEAGSYRYIEKKLSYKPTLPTITWQSRIRSWFLNTVNRSNIKFKAPKNVDEKHFPKEVPFEQIIAEWKTERQRLYAFLEGLDQHLFTKLIYKHPIGGKLSLANMLQFFDSHFDRHYKQIQRTLKQY